MIAIYPIVAAIVAGVTWMFSPDLRFYVMFLIALAASFTFGINVWKPMWEKFPPTFLDGIFQVSDIIYAIKLIITTVLMLLPWILPLWEVLP